MQWVEVAQADEIEKFRPRILNQVASTAEAPELMPLGTANGPTRLGPLVRAVSAASTMARVEGPPEPTIRPVRSLETSCSSRPESATACSMAMWPNAVPWARNLRARRSIMDSQSICGGACTWLRKPSSPYSGAATPLAADPAEVEADQLPERVETQAARHHRVLDEVAGEEPEVRIDVELGLDVAEAVLAAVVVDMGDAVEQQHRRRRQLGVALA